MKKRLYLSFLVLCLACARSLFAADNNLQMVFYLGDKNTTTLDIEFNGRYNSAIKSIPKNVRWIGKLTKSQRNIIYSALDEYEYEPGEIYCVCFDDDLDYLNVFVIEIDDDKGFFWKGFKHQKELIEKIVP